MDTAETARLPLFPLGTVLFPGMLLPLHIFEERYRRLLADRQEQDPAFGVILTRQGREVGDRPEIHDVGTAATVVGLGRYPDGRLDVVVRGTRRFRLEDAERDWDEGYLTETVRWLEEPAGNSANDVLAGKVSRTFEAFLDALERATAAEVPRDEPELDPAVLAYNVCARLPLNTWERQRLLELPSTGDRLDGLLTILRRERALLTEMGAGGAAVDRPGDRFLAN